jgi:hypothetical protein
MYVFETIAYQPINSRQNLLAVLVLQLDEIEDLLNA